MKKKKEKENIYVASKVNYTLENILGLNSVVKATILLLFFIFNGLLSLEKVLRRNNFMYMILVNLMSDTEDICGREIL